MPVELRDAIEACRELVRDDLERVGKVLSQSFSDQRSYLAGTGLELASGGKRVRPLLVLLCGRLCDSEPGTIEVRAQLVNAAAAVEVLHVASLIHDDIVDHAPTRRGVPSVNASVGNEWALLVGDLQYLTASRMMVRLLSKQDDIELLREFVDAAHKLCLGQMDELQHRPTRAPQLMRDRYLATIDRKTGALFSMSCAAGVYIAAGDGAPVEAMREFGTNFGRAFQIMDDLLDLFGTSPGVGKQCLTDLRERRNSLPIIYALEDLPETSKLHRYFFEASSNDRDFSEAALALLRSEGPRRAYEEASRYADEARNSLSSFQDSPHKDALGELVDALLRQRM